MIDIKAAFLGALAFASVLIPESVYRGEDRGVIVEIESPTDFIVEHFDPEDVHWAIDVMNCESNGDPHATNPSSGAAGLFQHMPRYWPERSAAAGIPGASVYDPEANVIVAAWLFYHGGGSRHWNASRACWAGGNGGLVVADLVAVDVGRVR